MMKWVDPIVTRFKLWPQPHMFRVPAHEGESRGDPGFGQRLAERMAAAIGSWRFLIIQSVLLAAWLTLNIIAVVGRWDPYPFILLNLMLSFQAAYTGPVLLIAANFGAMRDHKQYDRIEHLTAKTEDIGEKTRDLANRLIEVERQLDVHVSQSIQAHTTEIRELCDLVRAMHAVVVKMDGQAAADALASAPAQTLEAAAPEPAASPADAAPQEAPSATSAPRRGSPRAGKRG